jgi:hypothetical protein
MNVGDNVSTTGKSNGAVLNGIAARRLSNQIDRAHRGTYGAHAGLRTIVKSVARQMMQSGASRGAVSRALEAHLVSYSTRRAEGRTNTVGGPLSTKTLFELVRQCVDEVAREP